MQEDITEERKKQYPIHGLLDFFVNNFTNNEFEYGVNQFGICRYPLNADGSRIRVSVDSSSLFSDGYDTFDKSDSVASIISSQGDTPSSIYFGIPTDIDDIYSNYFGDLSCKNIENFIHRFNQHLDIINQESVKFPFKFIQGDQFKLYSSFKYNHLNQSFSTVITVTFIDLDPSLGARDTTFYITNHDVTSQATMKNMDMEFFKRYYKEKIREAVPRINFDDLYKLSDISLWDNDLRSLVKMMYY